LSRRFSESVETNSLEAAATLDKLTNQMRRGLNRSERHELLSKLVENESLAYWLLALAESDLALTRWDLLHLYWEQSQDPDTAGELAERVRRSFEARQINRYRIGELLDELPPGIAHAAGPDPSEGSYATQAPA
jgi:hypothetical protein